MGTGLIFAAVIALWVAYGVPLALRRYDEASRAGSVHSFSGAMRVLTHRIEGPAPDVPGDPGPRRSHPVLTRESARRAARRRRRTLIALLFALVVVGVLAGLVLVPWWSVAVPAGLLVAWLAACRVQVRGELGLSRRRPATSKPLSPDEEPTVVVGQREDHEPLRKHAVEDVPLRAVDLVEPEVAAVPVLTSTGGTLWDPLPVTLPTYVNKARAARTIRTIEFGEPGAATSGHVGEAVPSDGAGDRDAQQPHRRAVND